MFAVADRRIAGVTCLNKLRPHASEIGKFEERTKPTAVRNFAAIAREDLAASRPSPWTEPACPFRHRQVTFGREGLLFPALFQKRIPIELAHRNNYRPTAVSFANSNLVGSAKLVAASKGEKANSFLSLRAS